MQCTTPGHMRHPKTHEWLKYPCGQCLPCRVKKRSALTSRNLLESRTALSASFWTLTFADTTDLASGKKRIREIFRSFADALRKSEIRAGNMTPIRFFGCCEFGGRYGRPHFHLLIYNMVKNYRDPPRYTRGLPRPPQYIGFWPHGHVDIAEFNNATVNYCVEYMLKTEEDPIPFRTVRPAIGFYGIQALAVSYARKFSILPARPAYLVHGSRKFPLDNWTRRTFDNEFKRAGGRYGARENPRERTLDRLALEAAWDACPELAQREAINLRTLEMLRNGKEAKKKQIEEAASRCYLARQQRSKEASWSLGGSEEPQDWPDHTDLSDASENDGGRKDDTSAGADCPPCG